MYDDTRCIAGMVATLKQILSSQKKTDYKPEEPATAEVTQVSCTIVLLVLFIVYSLY